MQDLHALLQRQLEQSFGSVEGVPSQWTSFIQAINDAYHSFDNDKVTLERSLEVSSKELFRASADMRALFDALPDLFLRLDNEDVVVDCKSGSETSSHVPPDLAIGKSIYALPIISDADSHLGEALRRVRTSESKESIEYELCIANRQYYYEARLLPLGQQQIIVIIRDITARKQAELELQTVEQRLRRQNQVLVELTKKKTLTQGDLESVAREITEAAAGALDVERASVWLFNDQHSKITCVDLFENSAHRHSSGVELLASNYPAYFDSLESDRVIDAADAQHDTRTSEFTQSYLEPLGINSMLDAPIRLDGRSIGVICLEHTGPIRLWAIEEQHFAGSMADLISLVLEVRARKKAQLALSESEDKFRILAETTNSAIFVFQESFLYLNPAMAQLTGYTEQELFRLNLLDIVHPEYKSRIRELMDMRRREIKEPVRFEVKITRKGGEELWLLLTSGFICYSGFPASIATAFDITERKAVEEQLLHQAFHDKLTGLPNRALFMDRLKHVFNHAKRRRGPTFAVLFLDLDRFKVINDSLGHEVGDALLKDMAGRLRKTLRFTDTIARLGGDEFTILLENVRGISNAVSIAEKIRDSLSCPLSVQDHEMFMTASIGIALYDESYEQAEFLLRDADIAMYRAKSSGKACHQVFNSAMHAKAFELLQLETDLRHAIDRDQLQLNYQPIVSLETGRVLGFEALLRWFHHERDLISPMDFIPIAEETGIIVSIGKWVMKTACQQLRRWQETYPGDQGITVSVNVSAKQMAVDSFVDDIGRIVEETRIDPSGLNIELTETMLLDNPERVITILGRLRSLGLRIHVDDFGTGYSSLSYLNRYPLDVLKVDRSFVNMLGTNGENSELVDAIVSLAHSMRMKVTAEGIETIEQMKYLKSIGCEAAQGFYFSKPLPTEQAEQMISQSLDVQAMC